MRALRAVAYLANELQVRKERLGSSRANPEVPSCPLCVWLGGMYLMAMINVALFAIFLGFYDLHPC